GAVLVVVGALAASLLVLRSFTPARFLPLVLHEYPAGIPLRPWARQDVEAIEALPWRQSHTAQTSQKRNLLLGELKELAKVRPDVPVVVYLGGHVVARTDGTPCLLPVDGDLDRPDDWLPLPQILQDVARCPSRRKLLLVDVMQPLVLPTRGLLRSDV